MRARTSLITAVSTAVLMLGPVVAAAAAPAPAKPAPRRPAAKVQPLQVRAAQVDVQPGPGPTPPRLDPHDPNDFIDPIEGGHVISPFGYRSGRRHEGIDYKSTYGAPVFATFPGTVVQAGPGLSGYGNTVTLDLGEGVTVLFAHLAGWSVERGQVVERGDRIGAEGATGRASTWHVHYEVRENGVPRDPAPYLSGE